MTSSLAPLRHRPFRVVWTGALVSNIGTWMQAAALGYYTAHLTKSAGWSALVAAGEFAPTALLGPIGGALADRLSRRAVMIASALVQAVLATGLTVLMATSHPGAPVLAVYALANGCVFALGFPAFSAIMPELVPAEDLSGAIGLSSASWNLGRVVGPLLGTLLYQQAGISWVLAVNAASFFAVVLSVASIRVPAVERSRAPLFAAIAEGFHFARTEPGLRLTLGGLCLNALFVAPFIGLIPALVEKELGGGKAAVGWLIAGQGIGAALLGIRFGALSACFDKLLRNLPIMVSGSNHDRLVSVRSLASALSASQDDFRPSIREQSGERRCGASRRTMIALDVANRTFELP